MKIEKVLTGRNSGLKYHVVILLDESDNGSLVGDFEYFVEGDEHETYMEGCLRIEGNAVVDFDGCYDLPNAVKHVLNNNGYSTDW